MAFSPVVSGYTFTGTSGNHVAAINDGDDWVDDSAGYDGWMEVDGSNHYYNPYGNFIDCRYIGSGSGSITTSQYSAATITGQANDNDKLGVTLYQNTGSIGSSSTNSMYRVYYYDNSASPSVYVDRVIDNVATNLYTIAGAIASGSVLYGTVQLVASQPVLQVYVDSGSGPATYGSSYTDTSGSALTSGAVGICGLSSGAVLRGGPWAAGNMASSSGPYMPFGGYTQFFTTDRAVQM